MRRFSRLGIAASLSLALAGCPIYSGSDDSAQRCGDGSYAFDDDDCVSPSTGASTTTSWGSSWGCDGPMDCAVNETCASDNQCHPGDCTFYQCSAGYVCVIDAGSKATCQPGGSTGAGGHGGAGGGAGGLGGSTTTSSGGAGGQGGAGGVGGLGGTGGAPAVIYCGNPADCAVGSTCAPDGTCQVGDCTAIGCIYGFACDPGTKACASTNPAACGSDASCASLGAGYACVSGICTAPADQCFDQTQCGGLDDRCAAGKCTPSCVDDLDCPSGYACDLELGICSLPAEPCAITNDCGGPDKVCVDGACVPRSDGGVCGDDQAWALNGCIPEAGATFVCAVDGQQDACASGSICLHHSCYIACEAPLEGACDNLPSFNVCKDVLSSAGTSRVCGSNDNLGGECDLTAGKSCAVGKICIDGFCR